MSPVGPDIGTLQTAFSLPSAETVLAVIVTVVFIWWAVFTAVAGYHMWRYARDSWITVPALTIHLVISMWIFLFATGGI